MEKVQGQRGNSNSRSVGLCIGLVMLAVIATTGIYAILHMEERFSVLGRQVYDLEEHLSIKEAILNRAVEILANMTMDNKKANGDSNELIAILRRKTREIGFHDDDVMRPYATGNIRKTVNSLRREMYTLSDRLRFYMRYGGRSLRGLPGPPGEPGKTGPIGPPGLPGRDGMGGERGFPGLNGLRGSPGKPGESGKDGAPGANGIPGYPGYPGERGEKGERGYTGLPGHDGYPGVRGPPGDPGRIGIKGNKGEKGATIKRMLPFLELSNRLNGKDEGYNFEQPAYYKNIGGSSVVYIRWGSSSCPQSTSYLVYSGQTVMSLFERSDMLSGSNVLCMPLHFPVNNERQKRKTRSKRAKRSSTQFQSLEGVGVNLQNETVKESETPLPKSEDLKGKHVPIGPDIHLGTRRDVHISKDSSTNADHLPAHDMGKDDRWSVTGKNSTEKLKHVNGTIKFKIENSTSDDTFPTDFDVESATTLNTPNMKMNTSQMTPKETSTLTTPSVAANESKRVSVQNIDESLQEKNSNNSINEERAKAIQQEASFALGTRNYIPCSVCKAEARITQIMLPSRVSCPSGWSREYFGYLMAFHHNTSQSELLCVDHNALGVAPSSDPRIRNLISKYMVNVRVDCSTLPCPPLNFNEVVMCTVCTA